MIPKGTTHEYWKSIEAGAAKARIDLHAAGTEVEIIWKGPLLEDDREQQIQVVENFVGEKVSAIVIAPLDNRALVAPLEEAPSRARIPVIVIDSALNSSLPSSTISTDNRKGERDRRPQAREPPRRGKGRGRAAALRGRVPRARRSARPASWR